MLKKVILLITMQIVANLIFPVSSHANAECPASAPWPCVGSTIDSSTPMSSGGGGSIRFLSIRI